MRKSLNYNRKVIYAEIGSSFMKSEFKLNRCDAFMALWVMYYLQGVLYNSGGYLSMGLLGILLLISMVCAFKVIRMHNTPVYFRGLTALLILFSIYGFAHVLSNPGTVLYHGAMIEIASYNYIKSIYLSMLPIYPFYYYSRIGLLSLEKLKKWFFVFIAICTLIFFRSQKEFMALRGIEEATNNTAYMFLSLLPGVVLFRNNKRIHLALMIYIFTFVILGMKRGALFIGAVMLIYYSREMLKNSRSLQKIWVLLAIVLFVVAGFWFIEYRMETSDYMMQRVIETQEGDSSSRDRLYSFFFRHFIYDSSFLNQLFGHGANATIELYDNYAHNDWLEIATNQGLLGLLLYFIYWVLSYKTWKSTTNSAAKIGIALFLIMYFLKTMISMSYGDMTFVVTSVLGYYLAHYRTQRLVHEINT